MRRHRDVTRGARTRRLRSADRGFAARFVVPGDRHSRHALPRSATARSARALGRTVRMRRRTVGLLPRRLLALHPTVLPQRRCAWLAGRAVVESIGNSAGLFARRHRSCAPDQHLPDSHGAGVGRPDQRQRQRTTHGPLPRLRRVAARAARTRGRDHRRAGRPGARSDAPAGHSGSHGGDARGDSRPAPTARRRPRRHPH